MTELSLAMTELSLPPPFVVFSLPRSRSAWLSKFLSYDPWICGHDESRHWRDLEDVKSWFMQPFIGTVEIEAMYFWRLLPRVAPGARIVTVRRPVPEVVESLLRLEIGDGGPQLMRLVRQMDAKLDQIEARTGALRVEFADLGSEATCRRLFGHCLGLELDLAWWKHWQAINVQVDIHARLRYGMSYFKQLMKLRTVAKCQMLADLHSAPASSGPLTIQEEPLESMARDAERLFTDHCFQIGLAPEEWRNDLELLRYMDRCGLLQVMTARANGKLFGYLMTIVGTPSGLEPHTATHSEFYASKEWPGAGLKLQRAALAALAAKGIERVYMRSGTGQGARIEALYKRMGAEPEGKLFKLRIGPTCQ